MGGFVMADTSTQAVEAHAKTAERTLLPETAKVLRTLAAERDELVKQLRSRLELLDSTAIRDTKASARRTALEDAAKVADHHINGAAVAKNIRALIEEEQK